MRGVQYLADEHRVADAVLLSACTSVGARFDVLRREAGLVRFGWVVPALWAATPVGSAHLPELRQRTGGCRAGTLDRQLVRAMNKRRLSVAGRRPRSAATRPGSRHVANVRLRHWTCRVTLDLLSRVSPRIGDSRVCSERVRLRLPG